MADEQDEAPEIIARPPSHPITTTLLGVAIAATILNIGVSWSRLFSRYMPQKPESKFMEKHVPSAEAKKTSGPIDHYAEDFGKGEGGTLWYQVGKDLGVSATEEGGAGRGP
jgi:hypothetical protein